MLEEAVYLQETKGDLSAAIEVYQEIVDSDLASRAKAAEAQYRLAVCHQTLGNAAGATKAFESLVEDYPNQTKWVDAALERLPKPFDPAALQVPWVDGEVILLEMRMPTGFRVGYSIYTTELVEFEGRKLWRLTNRVLQNVEIINMLEVDPETLKPVYGYMWGSSAEFGEVSYLVRR